MASTRFTLIGAGIALLAGLIVMPRAALHGQEPRISRVAAVSAADLPAWDSQVDRMIRTGALELRLDREDTLLEGRRHMRFAQTVNGVPVYGGDIARQT